MDLQPLIDAVRVSAPNCTILPPGYRTIPNELLKPKAAAAQVECLSLQSLVEYIEAMPNDGAVVFASPEKILAALTYTDGMDEIGTAAHSARYNLKTTAEWEAWRTISGRAMDQRAFAEFIEEHLDEIHSQPAADVLTLATTLQGKRNVSFTNVADLANGDKSLAWEEKTDAKGAGNIRVPSKIVLRIPIFEGAEMETTYEVTALFRYRIADGRLTYEVKLLKTDRLMRSAFERVVEQLAAKIPDHVLLIAGRLMADRDTLNASLIANNQK